MAENKHPQSADYTEQETEVRMQAALRGARRVGPRPAKIMTPKRISAQSKKRKTNKSG